MPSSIPNDPDIALGQIVDPDSLANIEKIGSLQGPVDAAEAELNRAHTALRSMEMTRNSLKLEGIAVGDLDKGITDLQAAVTTAATKFATVQVKQLPLIAQAAAQINEVSSSIESPTDFNKSQVKQLPLGADSLILDAQYFSFDKTSQTANQSLKALKAFVSASTSFMGDKLSGQTSSNVQKQTSKQIEYHDIQGTLVITAGCTHRMSTLLSPFVIDCDKGIRAWNAIFKSNDDKIKVDDPASIMKIAAEGDTDKAKSFNILSGYASGSSFVGCVHILKDSSTETSQKMMSIAGSVQGQMEVGSWFSSYNGGFGMDSSFSNSVKSLLSSQNIQSHISMDVKGMIPTVKSEEVQLAVKQFSNFSPDQMMGKLAVLQNATADSQNSVASAAENARTGGQMVALEADKVKSTISAVGEIDDGKNSMLNINSLMTSFQSFVDKASTSCGMPISYWLKPITASQLAQMWVAKYLPKQYVTSAGDDVTPTNEPDTPGTGG